jgi:coenzyme PQQ precursor peptide PqqA
MSIHSTEEGSLTMKWHAPKFIEVACGMEINRYAPADSDEPILF